MILAETPITAAIANNWGFLIAVVSLIPGILAYLKWRSDKDDPGIKYIVSVLQEENKNLRKEWQSDRETWQRREKELQANIDSLRAQLLLTQQERASLARRVEGDIDAG
ncbi:MAG TPA: hypothetical protein VM715_04740 [Candidatus Acidoferrum sp.]|nr:hypothetical protein [Candidatus Acidoferrum sp.]